VMSAALHARGAGAERALERALASGEQVAADANDAGPGDRVGDAPGPGRVLVLVLLVPGAS
jgi:hypothetical protein